MDVYLQQREVVGTPLGGPFHKDGLETENRRGSNGAKGGSIGLFFCEEERLFSENVGHGQDIRDVWRHESWVQDGSRDVYQSSGDIHLLTRRRISGRV